MEITDIIRVHGNYWLFGEKLKPLFGGGRLRHITLI
jgi:hypothetical protein